MACFLLFHIFIAVMAASVISIGVGYMKFCSSNLFYLICCYFLPLYYISTTLLKTPCVTPGMNHHIPCWTPSWSPGIQQE